MHGRATASCARGRIVPVVIQSATEGLALTILDSEEAPLVGATVYITPEAGPPVVMKAASAEGGSVVCRAVPPGVYFVSVEHGEAGLVNDVAVDVMPGDELTAAQIRVDGDGGLRLRVVDGEDPVSDVRVSLRIFRRSPALALSAANRLPLCSA